MGSNGTSTVLVEVEQDLPEHFIPVSTGPGCFNRCTFLTLVAVFYVFLPGTFILISYLRDPERLWRPQCPEFRIQSATLYPLNSSSTNFTGTWDLKLVAINPNEKLDIYYDTLEASLLCSVEDLPSVLASTSLPPFFLTRRNQTSFSLKLPVVGGNVGDDADRTALSLRWGLRVLLCYRYKTTVSELKDPQFVVLSLSFPQVENGQGSIQNSTKT